MELIIIILLAVGFYYLLKLFFNRQPNKTKSSSELDVLKKRLRSLLYGDTNAQKRLIQAERKRSPHKSEIELYQIAIARLERDRGRH